MKKRMLSALLAIVFCTLALCPTLAFAEAAPTDNALPEGITIACVGDSITYGSGSGNSTKNPGNKTDAMNYPGQLATLISGDAEVQIIGGGPTATNVTFQSDACTIYNNGRASTAVLNDPVAGGDFASGALHVPEIEASFAHTDLDVVILMLGTNDSKVTAKRASGKTEQGNWDVRFSKHDSTLDPVLNEAGEEVTLPTPAQEFEARYRAILNQYFEMDSQPYVYCMLPIPALSNNVEKNYRISDENMREEINPLITSIVEDLQAEGKPIGLIDMRSAFPDPTTEEGASELQALLVDEVHPNSDGYAIMAQTIYDRLCADTHSLTYVADDADEGSAIPKGSLVIGDQTVQIKNTRGLLTKDGTANIGWSTEPDGQGTVYSEGDSITFDATTGDITLYPVWASSGLDTVTIVVIAIGAIVIIGLFSAGFVVLKKSKKNQ